MQKVYTALAVFREKISSVKKEKQANPSHGKYADLPSILEAIKEPLHEAGLALYHRVDGKEDTLTMFTTLAHAESGEYIESIFPIFGAKPQEIGSSMSYARRYSILALLDIPTEDDDGNSANEATKTKYTSTKEVKKWLNFKDIQKAIEGGTDTEILLAEWIKDNEYSLSNLMKECIRKYCNTGELVEPNFPTK
jgi:hypothetical protein